MVNIFSTYELRYLSRHLYTFIILHTLFQDSGDPVMTKAMSKAMSCYSYNLTFIDENQIILSESGLCSVNGILLICEPGQPRIYREKRQIRHSS